MLQSGLGHKSEIANQKSQMAQAYFFLCTK